MNLFIKLILRNLKQKKTRIILIFITLVFTTITLSTAVFLKEGAINARVNHLKDSTLNSQLLIVTKSTNPDSIFFEKDSVVKDIKSIQGIEYLSPRITTRGTINKFNNLAVTLIGIDYEVQRKAYDFEILSMESIEPFENKIIIGKKFSDENNIKISDSIELEVNNEIKSFKVCAIAENKGLLDNNFTLILPLNDLSSLMGKKDLISSIGVSLTDLSKIDSVSNSIKQKLDLNKYEVNERYDLDYYNSFVESINVAISIFSIFSILISLYLGYTSSKTAIYEKINQVATLKTLGATKLNLYMMFLVENISIAICASLIGIAVAIPIINRVISMIAESNGFIEFTIIKVLFIIVGVILTNILSTIISLVKVLSISAIDIIKGRSDLDGNKGQKAVAIVGALMLIISFIFFYTSSNESNGVLKLIIGLILFVVGFILIFRVSHWLLSKSIFRIFGYFGPECRAANKNFSRNTKYSKESIIITAMVISLAFVSFNLSDIISKAVLDIYPGIDLCIGSTSNLKENGLANLEGIENVYHQYRTTINVEKKEWQVVGLDVNNYKEISFEKFKEQEKNNVFDELMSSDTIVISTTFKKNTGYDIGDTVKLEKESKEYRYKIVGVASTFENMGKMLYLSQKTFERDFNDSSTSFQLVKIHDGYNVYDLENSIQDKFGDNITSITSLENMQQRNKIQNQNVFYLINILFSISIIVAFYCLNNNLVINILTTLKVYGIKRAVGMSKLQGYKITLYENLMISLEGGLFGILLGYGTLHFINEILTFYIGDLSLIISNKVILILIFISIIIGFISFLYPFILLRKLNIIDSIKGIE